MGSIKIVRRAADIKKEQKEDKNKKCNKVFILGLVDEYRIPKGKKLTQFDKEIYKIACLLDQSKAIKKFKNGVSGKLPDYIFGVNGFKELVKIVHSKNQIMLIYTPEFDKVKYEVKKGQILDIIAPTLSIMLNKRKIKNYILLG